ncbi:replication initiator protein A [Thioalkalivibrio sp. ALE16]|uniref:replication initiator protein A n=1 Tax=Thioalkalivibrio sp. ALE16 TaxID=1158172 RepID=UPI000363DC14|nr:replication initiator protein A [Thioalkalivibrio sp. ALE16]
MTEPLIDPDRYPNHDLFVVERLPTVVPKTDMPSMPDPYFALRAGDHQIRRYVNGDTEVEVTPSATGMATITDKDIWLYATAYLVRALDRNDPKAGRRLQFSAADFFRFCNRGTGGQNYQRLKAGLDRLAGTRIKTNVETGGMRDPKTGRRTGAVRATGNWGLLNEALTLEGDVAGRGREMMIQVELPEWLYRSVESRDVLTISEDYFKLRRPLDRRLYEIARKHCGDQKEWAISLEKLSLKIGASHEVRRLRFEIKKTITADIMPDYAMHFDSTGTVLRFQKRKPSRTSVSGNPRARSSLILGYLPDDLKKASKPGEQDLRAVAERLQRQELSLHPVPDSVERSCTSSTGKVASQGLCSLLQGNQANSKPSNSSRSAFHAMHEALGMRKARSMS